MNTALTEHRQTIRFYVPFGEIVKTAQLNLGIKTGYAYAPKTELDYYWAVLTHSFEELEVSFVTKRITQAEYEQLINHYGFQQ